MAIEAARALLEHGLSGLALLDVNQVQAAEQGAVLQKDFPEANIISLGVDVTSAESVKGAFEDAAKELGSIEILCCFAGVVGCTHAIDMTPEQWRKTMDINTTGSFLCAQAAAK